MDNKYNLGQLRGAFGAGMRKGVEETGSSNPYVGLFFWTTKQTDDGEELETQGRVIRETDSALTLEMFSWWNEIHTAMVISKPVPGNYRFYPTMEDWSLAFEYHPSTQRKVWSGEYCRDTSTGFVDPIGVKNARAWDALKKKGG